MQRVLVVDDDPTIRSLLALCLIDHFQVEAAVDGREAVELLAKRPGEFHAMILDLSMPRMSGFEVLEHLRGDPATDRLPVLVLTARSDRGARMDALVDGGHLFLAKPFEPNDLLRRLEQLLSRSDAGREAGRLGGLLDLDD